MNAKDAIDRTEQLQRELSPVVTVPAPGGELTIELSKHLPEAERLARAESMLHGMIKATEDALENPRPCVSNELLTRPSQLAQGVSDVARRREYETRHKETLERLDAIQTGQAAHDKFFVGLGQTVNEIDRNTRPDTPRPHDREVTQPEAAQILTDAGYKVSPRQVQNWDRFIKTNGAKGTHPPEGYRIELRAQYLIFKAWAENAAKGKRMKTALRQRRQRTHKTNA